MSNVPDDWGGYWRRCGRGHRYHLSEGDCGRCEVEDEALAEAADAEREDEDADDTTVISTG